MDSSMFDGVGKMLALTIIGALVVGAVAGIALWKGIAWIFQHLEVAWK